MNETYERPFRDLLSAIERFHPQTAYLLETVAARFGRQVAFHACEVILCLQVRVDMLGIEAAGVLTEDDLETLPYFAIMQDNLPALELMVDVLECFSEECELLDLQGVP